MNISSTHMTRAAQPTLNTQSFSQQAPQVSVPTESFTFGETSVGEKAAMFGLAGGLGAVGIGVPTGLAMGSVKSFMSGNVGLGIGLGVAAAASVPTIGITGLGFAAMTTDSGDMTGMAGYLTGGALATAVTGYAMFG